MAADGRDLSTPGKQYGAKSSLVGVIDKEYQRRGKFSENMRITVDIALVSYRFSADEWGRGWRWILTVIEITKD